MTVKRVFYTRRARQDLVDIWLHVATASSKIADDCLDRIEARCLQLGTFPEMGPQRLEIASDARTLVIERWLAIYILVESGVRIVRIVDGARDLTHLDLSEI